MHLISMRWLISTHGACWQLIIEEMLRDTCSADPDWGVVILRYFNPVGAHPSGTRALQAAEHAPQQATRTHDRTREQLRVCSRKAGVLAWAEVLTGDGRAGMLGEDPKGTPNNLMPYIAKVATGKRDHLSVFGNDYDTKDGTGVRDYLHIMDLSRG